MRVKENRAELKKKKNTMKERRLEENKVNESSYNC